MGMAPTATVIGMAPTATAVTSAWFVRSTRGKAEVNTAALGCVPTPGSSSATHQGLARSQGHLLHGSLGTSEPLDTALCRIS